MVNLCVELFLVFTPSPDAIPHLRLLGEERSWLIADDQHGATARKTMTGLGQSFEVTQELLSKGEHFACALYGHSSYASVNDLRYNMFCVKAAQTSQLPLT